MKRNYFAVWTRAKDENLRCEHFFFDGGKKGDAQRAYAEAFLHRETYGGRIALYERTPFAGAWERAGVGIVGEMPERVRVGARP